MLVVPMDLCASVIPPRRLYPLPPIPCWPLGAAGAPRVDLVPSASYRFPYPPGADLVSPCARFPSVLDSSCWLPLPLMSCR